MRGRDAGQCVPRAVEVVEVESELFGLDPSLDAAISKLVEERFSVCERAGADTGYRRRRREPTCGLLEQHNVATLRSASIALARAYPGVQVDGVDLDEASVADARRNASDAGVADRVRFEVGDAATLDGAGGYDLACIFEALHDMGDPVGALRQIRGVLRPGAPLLVVDERVADSFTPAGDEIERLNYAFSVLHCLPATLAESPVIANGTVLRADTVREWARDAGYTGVEVLPIANDIWRFYRLDC